MLSEHKSIKARAKVLGMDYGELAHAVNEKIWQERLENTIASAEKRKEDLMAGIPDELPTDAKVPDEMVEAVKTGFVAGEYKRLLDILDKDAALSALLTQLLTHLPRVTEEQLRRWDEVGLDSEPLSREADTFINVPPYKTLMEILAVEGEGFPMPKHNAPLRPGDVVLGAGMQEEHVSSEEFWELLEKGARLVVPDGFDDVVQVEGTEVTQEHIRSIDEGGVEEMEHNQDMAEHFGEMFNLLTLTGSKNLGDVPGKLEKLDETIDEDLKKLQEEEQ